MPYKEIHIWEFPSTKTYIRLNEAFRKELFSQLRTKLNYQKLAEFVNSKAGNYNLIRNYNHAHVYNWIKGFKFDRGKTKNINIPLWVLIEVSKLLSESQEEDNIVMHNIEQNIEIYSSTGKSASIRSKLPILFTPELVSIIFHFCGDGHLTAEPTRSSHYRQVNKQALTNFIKKLQNCFGEWEVTVCEGSKVYVPRVISDFYIYYFTLGNLYWDKARIPKNIKELPKEFLLAGLNTFIVDEGHIGDMIEIYSKNKELISDIQELAVKLEYIVFPIKEKFARGKLDSYRFYISLKSAIKFNQDIISLSEAFPTCDLIHKQPLLKQIVRRKLRTWRRRETGVTQSMILNLLVSKKSVQDLTNKLNIAPSSLREHLQKLSDKGLVEVVDKVSHTPLWQKVEQPSLL